MRNIINISLLILLGFLNVTGQSNSSKLLSPDVINGYRDTLHSVYNGRTLTVRVDTTQMLMGDHNVMYYDVPAKDFKSIDFSLLDTLKEADLEVFNLDSVHHSDRVIYTINFTVWKPYNLFLPKVPVIYDAEGIDDTLYLRRKRLFIRPPKIDTTKFHDSLTVIELIQPIKDIKDEPANWSDYKIWAYLLGLLVLVGLIAFIVGRRRRKPIEEEPEPEVIIPAHIIALGKLKEIEDRKLWAEGDDKDYYSALTYTIREYLENRYEIPALESTTKEVLVSLKDANLSKEHIQSLTKMLNLADLIKFAKAKATEEQHLGLLDTAFGFVRETRKVKIDVDVIIE